MRPPHLRDRQSPDYRAWRQGAEWSASRGNSGGPHSARSGSDEWLGIWCTLCSLAGAIWGLVYAYQGLAEHRLQYELSSIPWYLLCAIAGLLIGAVASIPLLIFGPLAIIYFVGKWIMVHFTG